MEVSGQLHILAALPPGKEPSTHWIGGWVGLGVGLEMAVKRKIPSPCHDLEPLIIQHYTTELCQILEMSIQILVLATLLLGKEHLLPIR
jgi:hypothetical protein